MKELVLALFLACQIAPQYQNEAVRALSKDGYDQSSLAAIRKLLEEKGTFELKRYSSGGASAVTVVDERALESAIGGLLLMQWDRDSVMQAFAERISSPETAHRGLESSLAHHWRYRKRFVDIISGGVRDNMSRPHIRYNAVSLDELTEPWGHAQNDALAAVAILMFATEGRLESKEALTYAVLLPHYFKAVDVARDIELGAWEDKPAVHASSIAMARVAMANELAYVAKNGDIKYSVDGRDYLVDKKLLAGLIADCDNAMSILPREYVVSDEKSTRADTSKVREADAAIINALALGALSGQPFDAVTIKSCVANIEKRLLGPLGINRYPKDIWDGRVDRKDLKEGEAAQWTHVSPLISLVMGDLYRRTGDNEAYESQVRHFNHGIAHVNSRYAMPEAYIIDPVSRKWVADANEPLAWAQAALLLSFDGMRQTLDYRRSK